MREWRRILLSVATPGRDWSQGRRCYLACLEPSELAPLGAEAGGVGALLLGLLSTQRAQLRLELLLGLARRVALGLQLRGAENGNQ
eukprot:855652-Pleurochrysis_carterae.AAC.1